MNLFIFVVLILVFDPFYCLGVFLHRSGWGGCDITRCHKRISLTKLAPFDTANTAQMGSDSSDTARTGKMGLESQ